jgi:hypothetical protein
MADDTEAPLDDATIERVSVDRDERRRLVRGYEHLVASIEELLFRHDPIGINFGDNTDEYRGEAEVLVLYRGRAASVVDLRRIVHDVFVKWFDADLAGPESRYGEIAAEIWALWGDEATADSGTPA